MSPSTLLPILFGVAALIFISVRQMSWQLVKLDKLFKMPALLTVAGVVVIAITLHTYTSAGVGRLDLVILGAEVGAAVFGGWLMGRLTQIEFRGQAARSGLTGGGLAVWFGFIALRIGLALIGGFLGVELAALPALILFMIAVVKGIQALTIKERLDRITADGRPERVLVGQY